MQEIKKTSLIISLFQNLFFSQYTITAHTVDCNDWTAHWHTKAIHIPKLTASWLAHTH